MIREKEKEKLTKLSLGGVGVRK